MFKGAKNQNNEITWKGKTGIVLVGYGLFYKALFCVLFDPSRFSNSRMKGQQNQFCRFGTVLWTGCSCLFHIFKYSFICVILSGFL